MAVNGIGALGETRGIELTPEFAQSLRTKNNYERQRPVTPAYIKALHHEHMKDRFDGRVIFLMLEELPNKRRYLINGNHTCEVVIATRKHLYCNLAVVPCSSMDEVNTLYGIYDNQRRRNQVDVLRAEGLLSDLLPQQGAAVGRAIRIMMKGFDNLHRTVSVNSALTNSEVAWLMEDWMVESGLYFQIFNKYLKRKASVSNLRMAMMNGATVAFALATFKYAGEEAAEFWTGLATGNEMPTDDMRHVLYTYILNGNMAKVKETKRKVALLANVWNHYLNNKVVEIKAPTQDRIVINAEKIPKKLITDEKLVAVYAAKKA